MRYWLPKFLLILVVPVVAFAEINAGEFTQYVLDFQKAYQENQSTVDLSGNPTPRTLSIAKLTVRFLGHGDAKADPTELGHCEWVGGTPTVVIDPEQWNHPGEWAKGTKARKPMMFHEFGHCVLRRDHCDGMSSEGIPNSVMSAHAFDPEIYYAHEQYYLQELFWTGPHRCGKEKTESEEKMDQMIKTLLLKTEGIGSGNAERKVDAVHRKSEP